MKTYEFIRTHVSLPELLTSIAEEAAELSQAALKYRRTLLPESQNPTDKDKAEALRDLLTEYADVVCTMSVSGVASKPEEYDFIETTVRRKAQRWATRLAEGLVQK